MQAAQLRYFGTLEEKQDDGTWARVCDGRFAIEAVNEAPNDRSYALLARYRKDWEKVTALGVHSEGFRVTAKMPGPDGTMIDRVLLIDGVRTNQQARMVEITAHEETA